jgi:hypothetical protein
MSTGFADRDEPRPDRRQRLRMGVRCEPDEDQADDEPYDRGQVDCDTALYGRYRRGPITRGRDRF